jgi:hypothetical protein
MEAHRATLRSMPMLADVMESEAAFADAEQIAPRL